MKKTISFCDLCKKEGATEDKAIQVIFKTDQTEGRSTKPYLSHEEIDICPACMDKVLDGNYIMGAGAQGYNRYWFKEKK